MYSWIIMYQQKIIMESQEKKLDLSTFIYNAIMITVFLIGTL